ncbi:MAG TPA: hypothetical protein VFZ32_18640 [Micromonosporaceae bacterium]
MFALSHLRASQVEVFQGGDLVKRVATGGCETNAISFLNSDLSPAVGATRRHETVILLLIG